MTDVTVAWSVCVSSVTLVHPAKAVGRNEMPFGRDTDVVRSSIVLDRVPSPPQKGEIWGSEPPVKILHCKLWPNHHSIMINIVSVCRNSATPYPMVPSATQYDFPFLLS